MDWAFRLWPGCLIGVCLWFFAPLIINVLATFVPAFRRIAEVVHTGALAPGVIVVLYVLPTYCDPAIKFLAMWPISAAFWGALGGVMWHLCECKLLVDSSPDVIALTVATSLVVCGVVTGLVFILLMK